jgi:hypothetical protein
VASRDRGARGADHAAEQAARTGAAKHADHGQPACLLDIGHETEKAEEGPSGPPSSAPLMVPVRVRRLRKRSLHQRGSIQEPKSDDHAHSFDKFGSVAGFPCPDLAQRSRAR